jgi:hypothetical protein
MDEEEKQLREWEITTLLQRLASKPEAIEELDMLLTDNDKLAYRADADLLVTIWELRYGDGWIKASTLAKEGFMVAVLLKLIRATPWVKVTELPEIDFAENLANGAALVHNKPVAYKVDAPCR